jgi:hypothetical protein
VMHAAPWQQPDAQEEALQPPASALLTQIPNPLQVWPPAQATHCLPFAPQAPCGCPEMHPLTEQHPEQLAGPQPASPPATHTPDAQLSPPEHATQVAAPVPQALMSAPSWHCPLELQQPLQFEDKHGRRVGPHDRTVPSRTPSVKPANSQRDGIQPPDA